MSKSKKSNSIGQLKPGILSYKWEIHNFGTGCKKMGEYFDSPKFSSKDYEKNIEWYLKLYPKGNKQENNGYISLCLVRCDSEFDTSDCIIKCIKFSFLKNANVKAHTGILKNTNFDKLQQSWGFSRFIHKSSVMDSNGGLLQDGTLTILCEIIFDPEVSAISIPTDDTSSDEESPEEEVVARPYEANYKQELKDFGKFLENKQFSDVVLTIDNETIYAHKTILASRSPVFQTMFQTDMLESKGNIVNITDIKYEVMQEFLRFIYTGRVTNIKSMAIDLLLAAEKYSISGLKRLCERTLNGNLTVDNAVEYLNLSVACNTTLLKSLVIAFIVSHRKEIVNKPEFQSLQSDIMCKVVQAIVAAESK